MTFVGLCRDEGGALAALEIEHYPGMAEAEIARVVEDARARWPLLGVRVIHRYGAIPPGEQIVLVATAAHHRGAAFAAAEILMDYMKTRAPFWKRARRADGGAQDWVEAKETDEAAAARWRATLSSSRDDRVVEQQHDDGADDGEQNAPQREAVDAAESELGADLAADDRADDADDDVEQDAGAAMVDNFEAIKPAIRPRMIQAIQPMTLSSLIGASRALG